jgi:hypothetical protein
LFLVTVLTVSLLILVNWLVHLVLRNELPVASQMIALSSVGTLDYVTLFIRCGDGWQAVTSASDWSHSLFTALYLQKGQVGISLDMS